MDEQVGAEGRQRKGLEPPQIGMPDGDAGARDRRHHLQVVPQARFELIRKENDPAQRHRGDASASQRLKMGGKHLAGVVEKSRTRIEAAPGAGAVRHEREEEIKQARAPAERIQLRYIVDHVLGERRGDGNLERLSQRRHERDDP